MTEFQRGGFPESNYNDSFSIEMFCKNATKIQMITFH